MSLAVNLTPDQSQQVIYNTLISAGIPSALSVIVTGQSGHETAGWTSHVYLTDNNAFGYGFDGKNYTSYSSVEESAAALAAYLFRRVNDGTFPSLDTITDPDQYAQLLQSVGYYTDNESNYSAGIMKYLNSALTNIQAGAAVVAANPISSGIIAAIAIFVFAFLISRKK